MPAMEPLSSAVTSAASANDLSPRTASSSESWKNVAGYAATLLAVLAAMTATLQLWRADLRVPFFYSNDNLMGQMFVQNILESGWVLDNPRLGAPGGQNLRDYPVPDVLHLLTIKLLGCASHDSGLVLNLYYLLGFPLTALSTYFVLRRFRLGRMGALTVAVLYACLPYHYMRMQGHLFLASYYLLPLMIWFLVRIYLGRCPFVQSDGGAKPRWRFLDREAVGAVVLCLLTGLAGVYYAFFSCFFLLAVAIKAALRERRATPLIASALLISLIGVVVGATLAPHLLYEAQRPGDECQ
jgi:phosphoglycerol transferase